MTTTPAARLPARQAAALLWVTLALMLAFVAGNVVAWSRDGFAQMRSNGWKGFWRGEPMQALARDLRETPVAAWFGQRLRESGWLVLGDLGPRVRQGCPGWLFLADEWQYNPNADDAWRERIALAQRVVAAWERRGVRVIMVVVPDKSRIEDAQRCGLVRPQRLGDRYDRWLDAMRVVGVSAVDLRPALWGVQREFGAAFDRTDTHWRWQGARASATAVAEVLRKQGFSPSAGWRMSYKVGAAAPRWGDLVRLAGIDALPRRWLPPPDVVESLRFDVTVEAQGGAVNEDALFGDAPVAPMIGLVGTSFSRNAHFADFLAWATHAEVANLARDGGGFAQSMQDAWQRWADSNTRTPVQWIVWETTERALEEELTDAERSLAIRLGQ